MKKSLFVIAALLSAAIYSDAQTKVFKEVGNEISSDIKPIIQDGGLVGYLVFTQLEKASADSINYKISILDENLNDIGSVNFREQALHLRAVAFEQDVLCLAYEKSNVIDNQFRNMRKYRESVDNAKTAVMVQFLGINGKIIRTNNYKVEMNTEPAMAGMAISHIRAEFRLKEPIQLRNLPGKGFVCFYGDETKKGFLVFDPAGEQIWQRPVKDVADGYALFTSNKDIYILLKKKGGMLEGGYELLGYSAADSSTFPKYVLKDKYGNDLRVIAFDNDPITGKAYLSGEIINPAWGSRYPSGKIISRGAYMGVFTINLNGHQKGDIQDVYSYWADGSQTGISAKGLDLQHDGYPKLELSFRDYQGNTYFAGSYIVKRVRWGGIAAAVVTSPLIITPILILGSGTTKYKLEDGIMLKQNAKGALTVDKSIPANNTRFYAAAYPFGLYDTRNFYRVSNSDTKTNYIIVDDATSIVIYNVNQNKILRTIPHKDGNLRTAIYPAKEGHVMVSEYNKKEKYTRFSIETL
jgi:hypothetical protein